MKRSGAWRQHPGRKPLSQRAAGGRRLARKAGLLV